MAKEKTNVNMNELVKSNQNAIIIAVAIVVLAVIFMYFRDKQQKRQIQLERIDSQMDVWEERPPQRQNTPGQGSGKIL